MFLIVKCNCEWIVNVWPLYLDSIVSDKKPDNVKQDTKIERAMKIEISYKCNN